MIDFEPEPALVDLRDRVRAFVRDVVIPAEPRDVSAHGLDDALRREMQDEPQRAGVFAPQVSLELGSLGLDMRSVE